MPAPTISFSATATIRPTMRTVIDYANAAAAQVLLTLPTIGRVEKFDGARSADTG